MDNNKEIAGTWPKHFLSGLVERFITECIPWLGGQEQVIAPVVEFVSWCLGDIGVRSEHEFPKVVQEKGPAILAAANDLKAAGRSPRQVVLRALLAAGMPADPGRRALIERVATHVDAIVADFDAWFLSWEHLAADPNAWQTGDIDRFLHIKDRGGFSAFSSQEWGLEWWVIIFIDGDGGGYFDPAASMQFSFAVKWQRVLGLQEASIHYSDEMLAEHVDWFLSTCLPMLPAARTVLKPDLSSVDAWQHSGQAVTDIYDRFSNDLGNRLQKIDPVVIWCGAGDRPDYPETLDGALAVYRVIQPHIFEMCDDVRARMDPSIWPDERLVSWMREMGALRDLAKAIDEGKDEHVSLPGSLPRDFIGWVVNSWFGEVIGLVPSFKTVLLEASPFSQEAFASIVTEALSNHDYPALWHEVAGFFGPPLTGTDKFYIRFWLALAIEWRSRLGYDITFSTWDDCGLEYKSDPRLPAFGIPSFAERYE